jgi:hypothetical protein
MAEAASAVSFVSDLHQPLRWAEAGPRVVPSSQLLIVGYVRGKAPADE